MARDLESRRDEPWYPGGVTASGESGLQGSPGFRRFWWASTASEFGTYLTSLAMAVLIKFQLHGSTADVGLVNACRWLPYAAFGLFAGALIDRVRRRPVQVAADLARGLLLAVPAVLALTDRLSIGLLAAFLLLFGVCSLAGDAASQAFLPRLVPRGLLTAANARIDQSSAVAQTAGPGLAGLLLAVLSAPWAFLLDAVTYVASGILLLGIRVAEPTARSGRATTLRADVREGLRWVYRHPMLTPFALATHLWFVFWGMSGAVLAFFILSTVQLGSAGLDSLALGIAGSVAGIGALVGSSVALRLGRQFGAGVVVVACHAVMPVAYVLFALAPAHLAGCVLIGLGQLVVGVSMGAENPNGMGYRQAVTPDHLQGRMNATMRSINRAMIVVGAPVGGLLAVRLGYRPTLWIVAGGFTAVALLLGTSTFRTATLEDG